LLISLIKLLSIWHTYETDALRNIQNTRSIKQTKKTFFDRYCEQRAAKSIVKQIKLIYKNLPRLNAIQFTDFRTFEYTFDT